MEILTKLCIMIHVSEEIKIAKILQTIKNDKQQLTIPFWTGVFEKKTEEKILIILKNVNNSTTIS